MRRKSDQKTLEGLPDIFYRYKLEGDEIVVTRMTKRVYRPARISHLNIIDVYYQHHLANGEVIDRQVSHPEKIRFGEYDGSRHCVFFKEPDKEAEAAMIFDQHLENRIASFEEKVKDCILKRKTLQQIMKGGSNGTSIQV